MQLTIRILGLDILDIKLTDSDDDNETDRGDATSQPVGFVARMEKPDEVDTPDRDR